MFGLGKILPMLMLAGAAKEGFERFRPVLDYTTNVAVQAELNQIAQLVLLDYVTDERLPEPGEPFQRYVRGLMQSQAERDTAKDMWGTYYQLDIQGTIVYVRSAGKDQRWQTGDDLAAKVSL